MKIQTWTRTALAGAAILAIATGAAFAQSEMTDKIRLENSTPAKYDFSVVGGNLGITKTDGSTVQNGQVGIGTTAPQWDLHLLGNDTDTRVFVENTAGAGPAKVMFTLKANNTVRFATNNTAVNCGNQVGCIWTFDNDGSFRITDAGDGIAEFVLDQFGNLTLTGSLNAPSDINRKTGIQPISSQEILDRVAAMQVLKWSYKETPDVRHVGPTAQDFHAAFGLGDDDKHIATVDADGVSLASIQALYALVQQQRDEITALRSRLDAIEQK